MVVHGHNTRTYITCYYGEALRWQQTGTLACVTRQPFYVAVSYENWTQAPVK